MPAKRKEPESVSFAAARMSGLEPQKKDGAEGRARTADACAFNAALYQLSYLGEEVSESWCVRMDLNHRRTSHRVYSATPLTTRALTHLSHADTLQSSIRLGLSGAKARQIVVHGRSEVLEVSDAAYSRG
jgi:hypothetical protein